MREVASRIEETVISRRIYASLIDWFLGGILTSLPAIIATCVLLDKGTLFTELYIFEANGFSRSYTIAIALSCLIVGFFYFVIIPMIFFPQQTLGKRICKLKIESQNGRQPTLKQYIIRQFFCLFFIEGIATNAGLFIKPLITLSMSYYVDHYFTIGWSFLTLVSLGLMIYHKKHLALHDILSKTRVTYMKENNL